MRWMGGNAPLCALVAAAVLLGACRYSPLETETACADRLGANLSALRVVEARYEAGATVKAAVITDVHNALVDLERVVRRINRRTDIAFAVVLGDLTDSGLAHEYEWACEALTELDVPRFYAIGNHDSLSLGKEIFRDAFAPFDYSFDFLGVRLVVYNDNGYEFEDVPDLHWLARAAAVAPGEARRFTVALSHVPPNAAEHSQAETARLVRTLADSGYDVTLHGHTHHYSAWEDALGVRHYVTGDVKGRDFGVVTFPASGAARYERCDPGCAPLHP